jgi:hypothetical protein
VRLALSSVRDRRHHRIGSIKPTEGWDPIMRLRLGDILIERGLLTAGQVAEIVAEQERSARPFGVLCEERFQLSADAVEDAWARQYATMTRSIDPRHEVYEDQALELVSRRQAWQFRLLPIRFEGPDLMAATTERHLRRALRFATRFLGVPVYFVMCDAAALADALTRRYPIAGADAEALDDDALDRLVARVLHPAS